MSHEASNASQKARDIKTHGKHVDRDPYLVAVVRASKGDYTENVSTVLDELEGTSLRRRVQLLTAGY